MVAVIAEEMGLIGALALIAVFMIVLHRGLRCSTVKGMAQRFPVERDYVTPGVEENPLNSQMRLPPPTGCGRWSASGSRNGTVISAAP